jgi:hypothetical protein
VYLGLLLESELGVTVVNQGVSLSNAFSVPEINSSFMLYVGNQEFSDHAAPAQAAERVQFMG